MVILDLRDKKEQQVRDKTKCGISYCAFLSYIIEEVELNVRQVEHIDMKEM